MRLEHTRSFCRAAGLAVGLALALSGCGDVVLTDGRSLSSAARLVASDEVASEARLFIDYPVVSRARTVRIIPTAFPETVSRPGLTPAERKLVANATDRALCYELSLKYDVVSHGKADLTVRSTISRVDLTNVPAAGSTVGLSAAITIAGQVGIGFADAIGKVPVPRVPIGLGSLTVEAEVLDARNRQRAAMIWGGAANAFTNQARFSAVSDAYDLAGEFGQDFGSYLVNGVDPFKAPLGIPSYDRVRITTLGEAPLDPDCEAFGRAPGVDGIIGDYIGLPPEWTDKGPAGGLP
ncbi:DUF3313 domain-containing protein [Methylobacterium organophilum]|uniref:DUF3313 domain-containing protein n=1 Tax=Methylobacterium organophilum TaxID=410 RepID=UPI003B84A225